MLSERRAVLDNVGHHRRLRRGHERIPDDQRNHRIEGLHQVLRQEIKVKPGKATVFYTLPTPPDSPIGAETPQRWLSTAQ